jgi:hypothetical protein
MKGEKYQLLPGLAPEQFEALKADIAARGVMVPVMVDEYGAIIDGHNRARACRELGINDYPVDVRSGLSEADKRALARQLNVLRRHLTREQVRDLIGDQIRDTPEWSNNRVAQLLAVDDKTVASVRDGLESTSEIPKLDKLVGADGKARPVRQGKKAAGAQPSSATADKGGSTVEAAWVDWLGPERIAKADHLVDLVAMGGAAANSEKVIKLLHETSICSIECRYDPFAHCTDAERRDWHVFMLFLVRDIGMSPEGAAEHVKYVVSRTFQNVAEWLKDDRLWLFWPFRFRSARRRQRWVRQNKVPTQTKKRWQRFAAEHSDVTLPALIEQLTAEERSL